MINLKNSNLLQINFLQIITVYWLIANIILFNAFNNSGVSVLQLFCCRKCFHFIVTFESSSLPESSTYNFHLRWLSITGMRLKFHQKSGSSEFSRIPDFQSSYILLDTNRSQSQLSIELWILKIGPVSLVRYSKLKVLQKAGTEIYTLHIY